MGQLVPLHHGKDLPALCLVIGAMEGMSDPPLPKAEAEVHLEGIPEGDEVLEGRSNRSGGGGGVSGRSSAVAGVAPGASRAASVVAGAPPGAPSLAAGYGEGGVGGGVASTSGDRAGRGPAIAARGSVAGSMVARSITGSRGAPPPAPPPPPPPPPPPTDPEAPRQRGALVADLAAFATALLASPDAEHSPRGRLGPYRDPTGWGGTS
jgi:hypothetical protein